MKNFQVQTEIPYSETGYSQLFL